MSEAVQMDITEFTNGETIQSGAAPAPAEKKPRKPRVAKPKEPSSGKVVVLRVCNETKTNAKTDKQPAGLRTKKQLVAWMTKNLGAGDYVAVRTVAAVCVEEEVKTLKKVTVL